MNTSPTRDFLIELRPIPQRFNSRRKFQSLLLVAIWRGVGTLLPLGSAFGVSRAQIIQTAAGGASGGTRN
jgi:hypothetical protein